jgi:phosphatidylinositol alpha-mannosyltransferase
MRAATVFCAPSLHGESFGVVLVEAMAAGTAVVASGLDGYRNVATDGVDAVLVEPGDAAALAQGLSRVLADPRLRERLVAAGTRRADDFSMTALAQRYVEHYERLAATGAVLAERPRGRRWSRMLERAVVPRLARASAFIDRSSP